MTALAKRKDEDLVLAAQNDCQDSFSELIKRHRPKLYSLCFKITRSTCEAEEALGDAELLLYQKIKQFKRESKYTTWAYRVTANSALERLRGLKRKKFGLSLVDNFPDPAPYTLPELRKEQAACLRNAIAALDEQEKFLFMSRYGQRVDYEIVAATLGITVPAAKSRTWRMTDKLRYLLRDWKDN